MVTKCMISMIMSALNLMASSRIVQVVGFNHPIGAAVGVHRYGNVFEATFRRRPLDVFSTIAVAATRSRSKTSFEVDPVATPRKKPVPMTLLSGFLGTGKTTTLKHLLENSEDTRIGVIVNDVAAINIDAKLISGQVGDMIELQNGCACCSLADELFFSIERLLQNRDFDAVVVELSGVADPIAIKNNWKLAPTEIRQMANVHKVVAVVDTQTFGTDYMTWDMIQDRTGWEIACKAKPGDQKISQLLAEQVEAADLVLLNKIDLATNEQVDVAEKVASALNDKAQFLRVKFGKVSPKEALGITVPEKACCSRKCTDHSHEDHHAADGEHGHSKSLKYDACNDPTCTDASHSHDHNDHDASCNDPGCTEDTSHSHSHAHSHATSVDALGVSNFVYKSSKPFSTQRMLNLLSRWPIPKREILDLEYLERATNPDSNEDFLSELPVEGNPFLGVLRAKGFCWFAPNQWDVAGGDVWRHDAAMFLSQAGRHMGISVAGKWWATVPKENLPKYFDEDNWSELERILRDDFVSEEFGDRRQELVFIGVDMNENAIREELDRCLLTDQEMDLYRQQLQRLEQVSTGL